MIVFLLGNQQYSKELVIALGYEKMQGGQDQYHKSF